MKKSIIVTCALVVILVLIAGDRFLMNTDKKASDYQVEMAAVNEAPQIGGMVTIEDGEVPLAAGIPDGNSAEVPSCLIGGAHNQVWTDCGDFKVMKCAGCGQEIGERATDLGGVYGYYDDAAAALLFNRTNNIRTGCELENLLEETAKQRALICVSDFSHDKMQTDGECIAAGQQDADMVIAEWNASEYHRKLMIDPMYTEGGSACLWYDAGNGSMKSIWVLVMN